MEADVKIWGGAASAEVRRPQTAAAEEACDQTPHTPARTGNGRWVPAPGLGKPVQLLSARRVGGGLLGGGGSWRFELCPEGAAALERLGGRRVAVVSVCGPRRSGKTSLVDGLRGGEKSGASAGTGGLWRPLGLGGVGAERSGVIRGASFPLLACRHVLGGSQQHCGPPV